MTAQAAAVAESAPAATGASAAAPAMEQFRRLFEERKAGARGLAEAARRVSDGTAEAAGVTPRGVES